MSIKIKKENIYEQIEQISTTNNKNNQNENDDIIYVSRSTVKRNNDSPIPILSETQLKIKLEKFEPDIEFLAKTSANPTNNKNPLPFLSKNEIEIKEEDARRKKSLYGLKIMTDTLQKNEILLKTKVNENGKRLRPMKKAEVEKNISKKMQEIQRQLIPEFSTFFGKYSYTNSL